VIGDDSRLKGWRLVFGLPQGSDFGSCVFNVADLAIELGSLFE
jgi:hypothetical protein